MSQFQFIHSQKITHLLHLELHGRSDIIDLAFHIVRVSQHGGELTGFVKTGSEKTGNLLDERLGSKESIVLLGELFDKFLKFRLDVS